MQYSGHIYLVWMCKFKFASWNLSAIGITLAKKIDKMGMRGSDTAVIYLEDVKVPAVNVIGDPGMGFSYQMIQVRFGLNLSKLV